MQPEQITTTTLSVSQLPEHPKWKRVSQEVACLLLDQGSKVYGWNLHNSDDLVTIVERIGSDRFASRPLGWLFTHRSMGLGGDRTAFWVETE